MTKSMDRLVKIAKKYKPRGVFVKFRRDHYLTPAHADVLHDGTKILYVPKLESREALFLFLHECAHHHLGHLKPGYRAPIWKMEYEAEMWAIRTMRSEGMRVPRAMIAEAKRYVAECAGKSDNISDVKVRTWVQRKFKIRMTRIPYYRKPKRKQKRED